MPHVFNVSNRCFGLSIAEPNNTVNMMVLITKATIINTKPNSKRILDSPKYKKNASKIVPIAKLNTVIVSPISFK